LANQRGNPTSALRIEDTTMEGEDEDTPEAWAAVGAPFHPWKLIDCILGCKANSKRLPYCDDWGSGRGDSPESGRIDVW
jgi:hypothetical protein